MIQYGTTDFIFIHQCVDIPLSRIKCKSNSINHITTITQLQNSIHTIFPKT